MRVAVEAALTCLCVVSLPAVLRPAILFSMLQAVVSSHSSLQINPGWHYCRSTSGSGVEKAAEIVADGLQFWHSSHLRLECFPPLGSASGTWKQQIDVCRRIFAATLALLPVPSILQFPFRRFERSITKVGTPTGLNGWLSWYAARHDASYGSRHDAASRSSGHGRDAVPRTSEPLYPSSP